MYKSIFFKGILFFGMCLLLAGCTQEHTLKTDLAKENAYSVEDVLRYSVEGGESLVEMVGENIIYTTSEQVLMIADRNGENAKELFTLQEGESIQALGCSCNQNILVITEKVEEEAVEYACVEFDSAGEQQKKTILDVETSFSPLSVMKDNEGRLLVLTGDGTVFVYKEQERAGQEIVRDGYIKGLYLNADGTVVIGESVDEEFRIIKLKENLQDAEKELTLNNTGTDEEVFIGEDGNDYFFDESYLYQCNIDKKIKQPVLSWMKEGLDVNAIKKVIISQEGHIFVAVQEEGQCIIKKLTPEKQNKTDKEELVMACVNVNSILREQILEFNNKSDVYNISVRDYGEEEDAYQALDMDIVAGKQFDIVCLDGLQPQKYVEKGILEDLSQYMELDEYVESYIEAVTKEDSIYQVSPFFSIQTIIGNAEIVGEESGWTDEEMMDFLEKNSSKRGLLYYDEIDLLGVFTWSAMDGYIKESGGEKRFQKEEFKRVLEFVKKYQDYALKNEKETDIPSVDMLYGGELLLTKAGISSGEDYRGCKASFDADIIAMGYPTDNRCGNYMYLGMPMGIYSKSVHKEAAWEFISYLLTDEKQYDLKEYGFPVKQKVLNRLQDEWCGKGKRDHEELTITVNGKEKKVPYMSTQDVNNLEALITSANRLRTDSPELMKIVREEAALYFEGQQDLESTGNYIEKRMNTYLEEQK